MDRISFFQRHDWEYIAIFEQLERGEKSSEPDRYSVDQNGWLLHDMRLCVPDVDGLIDEILREFYRSRMTIHPSGNKKY